MTACNAYAAHAFKLAQLRIEAMCNRDPISAELHADTIVTLANAIIHTRSKA